MHLKQRIKVRGESLQCAGGYIGHLTVDELLERSVHGESNLSCPLCGRVHLSREEIDQLEERRIIYSERYRIIQQQAEAYPS